MLKSKHKFWTFAFKAVVFALTAVFFLVPLWLILTGSFTEEFTFIKNGYSLGIGQFSLDAYTFLFNNELFLSSFRNSIIVSGSYLILSLIINTMTAYVLSEKKLPGHKWLNFLFVFSLYFNAGMIPLYLVIKNVGLYDSMWAMILPGSLSVYNVLLIRNYFYGISPSLKESASIDGASPMQILWHIIMPISKPILITTGLMSLVIKWNSWMDVLLYLDASSKEKWTLQYVVRQVLTQFSNFNADPGAPSNTVKSAAIVLTVLPMLILFPVFQKYFQNGIASGSVKG